MTLDFKPNLDKIVELLLYLAHKKPGADKYQAVKLLYLADKEHLNRHGRPITCEIYYALPYGPVASTAKSLLEGDPGTMAEARIDALPFMVKNMSRSGPDQAPLLVLGEPLRPVDTELFSKSDLRIFDEILETYGNLDFNTLFKITHDHDAYKKAWARRGGGRRSKIAYADMVESPELRERLIDDMGPVAARL